MIRPLADRIVVRPIDMPLSAVIEVVQFDKKIHRGHVLAVGPSVKLDDTCRPRSSCDTQIGDIVQFTEIYKFPEIEYKGERLLILQEADVCFVEVEEQAA